MGRVKEGGRLASSAKIKKKVGMRWVENCKERQQESRKENVGVQTSGWIKERRKRKVRQ